MESIGRALLDFEQVDTAYLHGYWKIIRPFIEQIRLECDEQWIAEDVYSAIRSGNSQLHVAIDDESNLTAFMVCAFSALPYTAEKVLFVWCAWCKQKELFDECDKYVLSVAKKMSARKIRMESPRKGWSRRGWREVTTIYERDVL